MGRSLLEAANKPRNLVETQQAPLPNSQSSRRDASTPSAADMGDAGLALRLWAHGDADARTPKPNSGYICLHRVALRSSTHTGFMNAGGDAVEKQLLPLLENLV